MNDYNSKYFNELENELNHFLFLCKKKDAQILLSQTKNSYSTEHLRLACICLVFGYKKIFLKIIALAEKYMNNFLEGLDSLNNNFAQVDKWVTDFIDNIALIEVQELAREFWNDKKEKIDDKNFDLKQLL